MKPALRLAAESAAVESAAEALAFEASGAAKTSRLAITLKMYINFLIFGCKDTHYSLYSGNWQLPFRHLEQQKSIIGKAVWRMRRMDIFD